MTRLTWGTPGGPIFDSGVDRGVLYPKIGEGVPWNGLISIKESATSSESNPIYIDGLKFVNSLKKESYSAAVTAFFYPEILDTNATSLSYRTMTNDGYKLHLVYNIFAEESDEEHNSINQGSEAVNFNWNISTTPVYIPRHSPSAHFIIDSTLVYPWALEALENMLYGTSAEQPHFPTIEVLLQLFEDAAILKITDHGDGSWTADGPDDIVYMIDAESFTIDYFTVIFSDVDTFQVSSW